MPIQLRAIMYYDVRPSETWTSNLEFDYEGSLEGAAVELAAVNMASGLAQCLLNNVVIDRVVASTWESDSSPYDPANVRTIPIGISGERAFLGTSPVDDDLTLFIRKAVASGRTGKIMLRGCMTLADLDSDSGSWTLDSLAQTYLEGAVDDYFTFVSELPMTCALVGKALTNIIYPACALGEKQVPIRQYAPNPTIRPVTGFVMVGPNERQDSQ